MKKSIEDINFIIEGINVYINNLLSEQVKFDPNSPGEDSDEEEEINKLKNQKSSGEKIDAREVYRDIKNGDFEKIFPQEELKKLEEWRDSGYKVGEYTIEDGKYAGKVITSAAYDSFRIAAGYKSAKNKILKNKVEKKVSPDVCNCIALARMYINKNEPPEEEIMCPRGNAKQCEKTFMEKFDEDMKTKNEYRRKTMEDYLSDCKNSHLEVMFDRKKRDDYVLGDNPWCENWNDEVKVSFESLDSQMVSLLNQWFRIGTKKKGDLESSEPKTIAQEIGSHNKVTINFDNNMEYSNGGTFTECERHRENLSAGRHEFTPIQWSPLSKGKTVVLEKAGKYARLTFKHAEKGKANEGMMTWLEDDSDTSPNCVEKPWKGQITRFD